MIEVSVLTTSPDETAAIQTLNAIYDYVRAQRMNVGKYPAILPLISSFEGWYGQLEVAHSGIMGHTIDASDVGEAKRRRQAINDAMGAVLPADITPADGPQTPPDKPVTSNAWIPYAVGATVTAILVYVLTRR
jgi:hypothetical protein